MAGLGGSRRLGGGGTRGKPFTSATLVAKPKNLITGIVTFKGNALFKITIAGTTFFKLKDGLSKATAIADASRIAKDNPGRTDGKIRVVRFPSGHVVYTS